MGKNKIERWAELATFRNVIQPEIGIPAGKDHRIKGNWNREMFGNKNPIILELGCGRGEYTLGLSVLFPDINFIGVDIKGARIWKGAKAANEKQLKNVAFLRTRIEFINCFFARNEVDEIWIIFPDPHTGKRNSNKRLTCPWFLNTYSNFLKDRGIIHLKTDNSELYEYTRKLVIDNGLEMIYSTNDMHSMNLTDVIIPCNILPYSCDPMEKDRISLVIRSIRTHYETKYMGKGMKINYLAFRFEKKKQIVHEWEKTK